MTSQEQLNNIINGYKLSVAEKNLRISELEKIVKAVAHIGINFDFGFSYGGYELEAGIIDDARTLMEQTND